MTNLEYDLTDKESIIEFAKKLKEKTLSEVLNIGSQKNTKNKGGFGTFLERYYFSLPVNIVSEPDFKMAGLELKTTPLKRLKDNTLVSKERLVLNNINYLSLVKEVFYLSSFYKKNKHLLLVFYLHELDKSILDYIIKIVGDWTYQKKDLEIIKKDWETIKLKVQNGKAHELSEGDTSYLGACTKSANSRQLRKQPNSDIRAKPRAFSLKQGYVNHIIATLGNIDGRKYGRLIESKEVAEKETIESLVLKRLNIYYGKSTPEIERELQLDLNKKSKNLYHNLTKAMLGIGLDEEIEEFEKAEITVRTVRVEQSDTIKEHISFPAFKFSEVMSTEWEDSGFNDIVEKKFLFLFLKNDGTEYRFVKAKFWNMGYLHRLECEKVYNDTKSVISSGKIVYDVIKYGDGIRHLNNFPKPNDSNVCHVRPHAKNAADTYQLPVPDRMTGKKTFTKQSFWLNKDYVLNEIYKSD